MHGVSSKIQSIRNRSVDSTNMDEDNAMSYKTEGNNSFVLFFIRIKTFDHLEITIMCQSIENI